MVLKHNQKSKRIHEYYVHEFQSLSFGRVLLLSNPADPQNYSLPYQVVWLHSTANGHSPHQTAKKHHLEKSGTLGSEDVALQTSSSDQLMLGS